MKVRVSAVQYDLYDITHINEFKSQVEHYIKTAHEFGSNVVLFPEFLTTQLMSILKEDGSAHSIEELPLFTETYKNLFVSLAKTYNMTLIGGTHIVEKQGKLYNTAHVFHPNGVIETQEKLHITPFEVEGWNIQQGKELNTFTIHGMKAAVLTCYDIEFPEIVRMAKAKGADVIFCPSCTDDKHGFYRVRYTSHARAIENEVYVVTTGTVGSLKRVDYMRANTGQAAIITPNDIPFPPQGILVQGELNQSMIVTADIDMDVLHQFQQKGSVTTWKNRRTDLYTDWK